MNISDMLSAKIQLIGIAECVLEGPTPDLFRLGLDRHVPAGSDGFIPSILAKRLAVLGGRHPECGAESPVQVRRGVESDE